MKSNFLLGFLVLFTSFLIDTPSVYGEPAEIFKPLIGNIRSSLPSGLSMRLPSYIPVSDTPIYSFVTSDEKGLRVNSFISCSIINKHRETGFIKEKLGFSRFNILNKPGF